MYRYWFYEIRDQRTHEVLKTATGFETENDAEAQAVMEIRADNIKGCYIHIEREEK